MPRASVGLGMGFCLALSCLDGCSGSVGRELGGGPIVQQQRVATAPQAFRKVAVIPFYPAETLGAPAAGSPPAPGTPAPPARWEIAAMISNFVAESLSAEGISVVGPNDVELAFTGEGHPVPRLDPRAAVQLSQRSFDASAVVLGKVLRYQEREGGSAGATRPAGAGFEVSLYEVPTGRRLWSGRFNEVQQSPTANIFRARQYPGGGTRWLSAAEFARWGASQLVQAMTAPGP